mmetsp:Transcript_24234/g.65677  ORF Transcript_24234/g.65677 Transcript_24234/m.65677 type:complete len:674 (-) Transcript_24234:530-2551(-)
MSTNTSADPVIDIKGLSFSYEVAQNINSQVIKQIADDEASPTQQADTRKITHDGGLSVDFPRRQYEANEQIVYKVQLRDINLMLPRAARCLLVGSNGSGKSTLLNILGGKHMVGKGEVRVLGSRAFEDTALANEVALLTGNWTRTVAFVGHNVPYQAMEVDQLIETHSKGVDPARVEHLEQLLGVQRCWNLTAASDGQRRRVQILLKLLKPFQVLLLDEITTDLDLLVRQELLAWLKEECDRGVTVVYCTHIFDGLDGWATHVVHVEQTRLRVNSPVEDVPELRAEALQSAAAPHGAGTLFSAVQEWLLASRPEFRKLLAASTPGAAAAATGVPAPAGSPDAGPAIHVSDVRWSYPPAGAGARPRQPALKGVTCSIARGERVLLTGANGAGKTTLLRLMGGKHMIMSGALKVLNSEVFSSVQMLNTRVALLTGDWSRTVATVGSGVPHQADFSANFMAQNLLRSLKAEGVYEDAMLDARLARLQEALDIDGEWRMNAVSDGQRRRIQILLKLLRPVDVMLMDEVTTDLDVLARQSLLRFLAEESDVRGVTVVYATHILDGLDGWPTKVLHVAAGKVLHYGSPEGLAELTPAGAPESERAKESGSLYRIVRAKLRAELDADVEAAKTAPMDIDSTPATEAVAQTKPVENDSLSGSLFGSRFSTKGGGRQMNMYG